MKKGLLILFIVVFLLFVSITGCSNTAATSSTKGNPLTVQITATPIINKAKVKFDIKTNLPDDTKLMVGFSNPEDANYYQQENLDVKNGTAQTKYFDNNEKGLPSGKYNFEVTTLVADDQPDSVRQIFGERGNNLTGASITTDDDLSSNDKFVDYTITVKIN